MAKKSAKPKTNSTRIGQQTKTSTKGAHGGGVKFGQVSLGSGFKNITPKGAKKTTAAAKLPQPKKGISEDNAMSRRPAVVLGKGFGANPFLMAEAKKGTEAVCGKPKPPTVKSKSKGK